MSPGWRNARVDKWDAGPQFELEHLLKLNVLDPFLFEMHPGFEREIRHLWELGFIRKKRDFKIAEMPPHGNFHDFMEITEHGKTFVELRGKSTSS